MRLFSTVGNSQSLVKEMMQKRVVRAAEGFGQHAAMIGRQIEIIHRAGDVEIGIGVEAVDEGHALVMQIGFDLEIRRELEATCASRFCRLRPNLRCSAASER